VCEEITSAAMTGTHRCLEGAVKVCEERVITSTAMTGTHRCLEGAVKVCEERVSDSELHHSSFDQVAIDVVVFQHDVLLERFDGVHLLSALQLCQQHLHQ